MNYLVDSVMRAISPHSVGHGIVGLTFLFICGTVFLVIVARYLPEFFSSVAELRKLFPGYQRAERLRLERESKATAESAWRKAEAEAVRIKLDAASAHNLKVLKSIEELLKKIMTHCKKTGRDADDYLFKQFENVLVKMLSVYDSMPNEVDKLNHSDSASPEPLQTSAKETLSAPPVKTETPKSDIPKKALST